MFRSFLITIGFQLALGLRYQSLKTCSSIYAFISTDWQSSGELTQSLRRERNRKIYFLTRQALMSRTGAFKHNVPHFHRFADI